MSDLRERLQEAQRKADAIPGLDVSIFRDADAEIASLRAQLAEANGKLAALNLCEPGFLDRKLRELDQTKAQLACARKALEPFASATDGLLSTLPDGYCIVLKMDAATPFAMIKVGELRAAKTVLTDEIREGE